MNSYERDHNDPFQLLGNGGISVIKEYNPNYRSSQIEIPNTPNEPVVAVPLLRGP
jgi:hypothetical protein